MGTRRMLHSSLGYQPKSSALAAWKWWAMCRAGNPRDARPYPRARALMACGKVCNWPKAARQLSGVHLTEADVQIGRRKVLTGPKADLLCHQRRRSRSASTSSSALPT